MLNYFDSESQFAFETKPFKFDSIEYVNSYKLFVRREGSVDTYIGSKINKNWN